MSDDVIFKQEVRDKTLGLLRRAILSLDGIVPQALPAGHARDARDCVVARVFNAALPQPVVVRTDKLLVAAKSDAKRIHRAWGTKYRNISVSRVSPEFRDMFEGLEGIYEIDLPNDVIEFIWFFDNRGYEDLQLPASDEHEEFATSFGGSGSEGGGINAELGGSEASPFMVGGGCGGGTGGAPVMVGGSEAGGGA